MAASDGSTPAPTIAQSWSMPVVEQIVEIDRLMGAVEIADAEVHDARRQRRPLVGRYGGGLCRFGRRCQR